MILTPEYIFKTIECIHPDFLAAHGIKALVLDVDNTLTADNSQVLEHTVQAWLDEMRAAGEVEVEGSTIYHKTEYRERRNHYALFTVNTPIDGFDTSRDAFLGAWRSNANPEVVENGRCTNSVAHANRQRTRRNRCLRGQGKAPHRQEQRYGDKNTEHTCKQFFHGRVRIGSR